MASKKDRERIAAAGMQALAEGNLELAKKQEAVLRFLKTPLPSEKDEKNQK
jgi:hypothetical protein